jgi:hypothetical protein
MTSEKLFVKYAPQGLLKQLLGGAKLAGVNGDGAHSACSYTSTGGRGFSLI